MRIDILRIAEKLSKLFVMSLAVLPVCFVLANSLRCARWSVLPFSELLLFGEHRLSVILNYSNYLKFFSDPCYIHAICGSMKLALCCVLFVVPFGFLIAVGLTQLSGAAQRAAVAAIATPMFIPFVVKLYAWMYISEEYLCAVCSKEVAIKVATWMFCCHAYLPMAVLFIKEGLSKIDPDIPQAAADLGASRGRVIVQILLPLSASSVLTSAITTSILAFGEFVIPEILGNGVLRTIGGVASAECLMFHDLPMSATVAVFMMLWSLIPVLLCRYMALNALRYVARV